MLQRSDAIPRIVEQVACRAHATPNYVGQGLGASLATHALVAGGYSLYLFCAAWLTSADLPEWLPPQSGVRSRPQVSSQAIVLEAAYREPLEEEIRAIESLRPTRLRPPEVPLDAAEIELEPLADRHSPQLAYLDPALHDIVADPHDVSPPAEAYERASERESLQAPPQPNRAAQVAKRGHGVAIQSATSVASVAAQESHGAETDALPQQLYNPEPDYPARQYAARIGGTVKIRIQLADDGHVAEATVHRSSGVRAFDQAALDAVARWRFEPASAARRTARELVFPIRFVPPQ